MIASRNIADIEELTEGNDDFRRVLYTAKHLQLVLMAIAPGADIGEEVHKDRGQFFRVEKGKGEVRIDGVVTRIKSDDAFIVPAGARHNVVNTGPLGRAAERNKRLGSHLGL